MYQAVIFDLDGTLLNTLDDLADAGNHVLRALGFPTHPTEAYKRFVGNGIPKLIERMLPPQARGVSTQELALHNFRQYYGAHSEDKTAPYPGIPALLRALHAAGLPIGVVSNKEDSLTQAIMQHYFPDTFDSVAGHTLGTPTKPDPHLVVEAAMRFGVPCGSVLYVGDSDVDVDTARNAGCDCCGVLWGFRTREELAAAAHIAETPQDVFAAALSGRTEGGDAPC